MIKRAAQMKVETREKMRGGDGVVQITHFLDREDFGAKVRLCARLVLAPGSSIGEHKHEEEDELFVITKGTGLLKDGAAEVRVKAGDAVLTGRGASHSIRNDGGDVLEITAVIICY